MKIAKIGLRITNNFMLVFFGRILLLQGKIDFGFMDPIKSWACCRIHQALDSQPRLASILSKHNGRSAVVAEHLPTASSLSRSSSSTGKEELISCNAAWHRMIKDRMSTTDPKKLIDRFNIKWIKKKMKVLHHTALIFYSWQSHIFMAHESL